MVPREKWQPNGSRGLVSSYEEVNDAFRNFRGKRERRMVQEGGSEERVVDQGAVEILIQNT